MKVVIISGGHIDDTFAIDWLEKNTFDLLIAADSGMDFLHRNGIVPNVIAGDFDSANTRSLEAFLEMENVEVIRLNPVKDDTDTEFVIREAIRRGATEIALLGATGTRLDHVLANIHVLGIGLENQIPMYLLDANNRVRMVSDSITLTKEEQFGDYLSILPIAGAAKGVTLKGVKYPLENATILAYSSLGVSNEITDDSATISVLNGVLLVIESKDGGRKL